MTNSFVFTNFFLDTSTLPLYLLFHQFQHQIYNPARPAAVRDANWHTDAKWDAKRQTKRANSHAKRRSRRKLTSQQISEINRNNALNGWGGRKRANSHPADANPHDANPHIASRACSSSFCIEVECEVEKERETPADPILTQQDPPSPGPQAHHPRQKNPPRSRKRHRNTWRGEKNVTRVAGAELGVVQRLGERAGLYSYCKVGFLSRRQGLYFWEWFDVFSVHQFLERHKSITVEQIDEALDAYFSEGMNRVSAKTVFDGLGRDLEKTHCHQRSRYPSPSTQSAVANVAVWREPTTPEEIAAFEEREREAIEKGKAIWMRSSPSLQKSFPWDPKWGPKPEMQGEQK